MISFSFAFIFFFLLQSTPVTADAVFMVATRRPLPYFGMGEKVYDDYETKKIRSFLFLFFFLGRRNHCRADIARAAFFIDFMT